MRTLRFLLVLGMMACVPSLVSGQQPFQTPGAGSLALFEVTKVGQGVDGQYAWSKDISIPIQTFQVELKVRDSLPKLVEASVWKLSVSRISLKRFGTAPIEVGQPWFPLTVGAKFVASFGKTPVTDAAALTCLADSADAFSVWADVRRLEVIAKCKPTEQAGEVARAIRDHGKELTTFFFERLASFSPQVFSDPEFLKAAAAYLVDSSVPLKPRLYAQTHIRLDPSMQPLDKDAAKEYLSASLSFCLGLDNEKSDPGEVGHQLRWFAYNCFDQSGHPQKAAPLLNVTQGHALRRLLKNADISSSLGSDASRSLALWSTDSN